MMFYRMNVVIAIVEGLLKPMICFATVQRWGKEMPFYRPGLKLSMVVGDPFRLLMGNRLNDTACLCCGC